jgi:hypothetical protein
VGSFWNAGKLGGCEEGLLLNELSDNDSSENMAANTCGARSFLELRWSMLPWD